MKNSTLLHSCSFVSYCCTDEWRVLVSHLNCIFEFALVFFIALTKVLSEQIRWTKVIHKLVDVAIVSLCVCSVKHCHRLYTCFFQLLKFRHSFFCCCQWAYFAPLNRNVLNTYYKSSNMQILVVLLLPPFLPQKPCCDTVVNMDMI